MTLEQVTKVAQIATAGVALVALAVAWISVATQKATARRQAAIDFFLKTEMDQYLRTAYDNYRAALEPMNKANSIAEFFRSNPSDYWKIRTYLDINELISVGINNKVFDQRVCHGFWSTVLTDICRDADKVIVHARKEPHGEHAYDQLIEVNARWVGPPRIWQRWRDGD